MSMNNNGVKRQSKAAALPMSQMSSIVSGHFNVATAKRSTVRSSTRMFSVNLAHYVTDTGHNNTNIVNKIAEHNGEDDSDGDVCEVTMVNNLIFNDPLEDRGRMDTFEIRNNTRTALSACNGLRFDSLSSGEQDAICGAMTIRVIPASSSIVHKNKEVDGILLVVSDGTAVTDIATGEWYSQGKLFNVESLAFSQHISPYSLRAGNADIVVAVLTRENYKIASSLRLNYLRSKYPLLDTLSDSSLRRFKPEHHWVQATQSITLDGTVGLMTHGVVRHCDILNTERIFPGQTLGICEYMSDKPTAFVAETFVGYAMISRSQFDKFMSKPQFMLVLNTILYQRSVILENYSAAVVEETDDTDDQPITFTTRLCKTYDEDGVLKINQYKIIKKIGTGATAAVFAVDDEIVHKQRVMKIVKRKDSEKSLQREIHVLKTLVHPNVIRAYDIIDCDTASVVIFVQQLAEWGSLLGVVLSMPEAKYCALGCCRALMHLHQAKLIHGDVKPANILRNKQGRIKLADFGCTTHVDDAPDARPLGTPAFMAPEILNNQTCQASDVWALMITFYCVIYGAVPFKSDTINSLRETIMYSEVPLVHIGASEDEANFNRLLEEGLRKDPTKRLQLRDLEHHDWIIHNPPRSSANNITT